MPIIADDFKVDLSSPNELLKFISAAFSMAGGLVAFGRFGSAAGMLWRDDAKASATLFGGSLAASAAQAAEAGADPSPDMAQALRDAFGEQRDLLEGYLKLATGGEGDKNELPDRGPVDGGEPRSAIARCGCHDVGVERLLIASRLASSRKGASSCKAKTLRNM